MNALGVRAELELTARAMTAPGKGILAADESSPTIRKRFAGAGIECTDDARRTYREMLFTAGGLEYFVGGIILFDETIRQAARDGTPMVELIEKRHIVPGIKVDKGLSPLAMFPGETVTEGLDGLRERLAEYRALGAGFAKWRAVIHIGDHIPTLTGILANAQALARYAALCQEVGLVPIVEPEVLMDGPHSLATCQAVTGDVLDAVFDELVSHRVHLEGMVLKPNMVVAGNQAAEQPTPQQIATATLRCLRRSVPAAVPGIAFLSGGQSEQEAAENLNAINVLALEAGGAPWQLTFSFGRALQATALRTWAGREENLAAAQNVLLHRARLASLARQGRYAPALEALTRPDEWLA